MILNSSVRRGLNEVIIGIVLLFLFGNLLEIIFKGQWLVGSLTGAVAS